MIKIKHPGSFLSYIFFILAVSLVLAGTLPAQNAYTISGTVTSTGGRGVDGVSIEFFDGETTQYETTAGGGHYSHPVYAEWSGTVTPRHDCYSFTPTFVDLGPVLQNIIQDFTASFHTYTIAGIVSDGPPVYDQQENLLNPLPGVLLSLSTGSSTSSAADGTYSFTVYCGWFGTVTPIKTGWQFSPPSINYPEPLSSDQYGQDFVGTASSTQYTISGRVTDESGRIGMAGVTIEFFDGVTLHTETTSADGYYSYAVPTSWTGTVTPSLIGYTFSPVYAALGPVQANINQDFVAKYNTYTISGTVMDDRANPIPGVIMTLSTGSSKTTNPWGHYEFEIPHGWSGNLVPSKTGWSFMPIYRSYSSVSVDHASEHFVGTAVKDLYMISGTVTAAGVGLASVAMMGLPGNPTTTASGFYSASVPQGWTGTVTPTRSGYAFKPSSRDYSRVKDNYVNENYEALVNDPPQVTIVSPPASSFVNGEVIIKVEASDSDGISKVEIYIDDQKVAEYLNIQDLAAEVDPHDLARVFEKNLPALQFDNQGNTYSIVSGRDGKMSVIKHKDPAEPTHDENLLENDVLVSGWLVKPDGTVILAGITTATGESFIKTLSPRKELSGITEPWVDIKWNLNDTRVNDREMDFRELISNPAVTVFTSKYLWDTSLYSPGPHQVKAKAFDTRGLSSEHEIELTISSVKLHLQLERGQETAWIINREYVKITATLENPESVPISKYLIYRKAPGEGFLVIGEVPNSEVPGNSFTYYDKDVEKKKQYTYKIEALGEDGTVVSASEEKTI